MEHSTSKEMKEGNGLSLGLTLFEHMKKHGNKILQYIEDTGEVDTYAQVLSRCIRTALKLKEKGVTKNDIISTCTHNQKNSCVPLLASLFLGVKPANFDPNLPHIDTVHLLKLVQPKILFVSTESLSSMEKCLKESGVTSEIVVFGDSKEYSQFSEYLEPNPEEENFRPVAVEDSRETAIIMFSSGTTGLPKGICLNHYSLIANTINSGLFQTEQYSEQQFTWLVYTTFYWLSAITFFIRCLTDGGATVVCSKFDPANAWRIIEKYKVTAMFVAPRLAYDFAHSRPSDIDNSSLKMLFVGGSTITQKLLDDLRVVLPYTLILQGYGQTEVPSGIAFTFYEKLEDMEMQRQKPLSCGKPIPGIQWKVVDPENEKTLGPNEKGELRVKSDFIMNGYYKMDSSAAFDSEGYLKTGDVVFYDEDGYLYVVDRVKEMFKYKGWHILPVILEEVLISHPAVKDAVVVGIPHDIDGAHPMGIVVLHENHQHVKPKELELFVEERVAEIQRLRAGVKIVNEILRSTTSKLRRNEMIRLVLSGEI